MHIVAYPTLSHDYKVIPESLGVRFVMIAQKSLVNMSAKLLQVGTYRILISLVSTLSLVMCGPGLA